MNLYKKKYLYTNGSSVTAGGGFESIEYRSDIREVYSKKGIELPKTQIECSYPYFLAKSLNLELINDAKSGSGIDRLVRRTFDWVMNNPDKLEETIILLEPQTGIRLDWFVTEWNDYGVLNAHKNEKGEYPFTLVKEWFVDDSNEQVEWNNKYKSAIDGYLMNFFDGEIQFKNEYDRLLMLLSFLNQRKIDYLVSIPSYLPNHYYDVINEIVPYENNLKNGLGTCIWEYARNKKLLISNEIEHTDNHIGYFGNKEMSEKIYEFIKYPKKVSYWSPEGISLTDGWSGKLFENYPIKFVKIDEIQNADFLFLGDFNIFDSRKYLDSGNDSEFIDTLGSRYDIIFTESIQNKNILIILAHERIFHKDFLNFLKFLENKCNIKKSNIFYIDSSVSNHPSSNIIPLEIKTKMYSYQLPEDIIDNKIRSKKATILARKLDDSRLMVFDRFLFGYNDWERAKSENNITAVNFDELRKRFIFEKIKIQSILKNDIKLYSNIGLPWKFEEFKTEVEPERIRNFFKYITEIHSTSIVSIVSETQAHITFGDEFNWIEDYYIPKDCQFSEKSLLPILSESFVFFIMDSSYYNEFENIGFDFSYLKKLFNIDYKTNTHSENIEEVYNISKFLESKSIEELNKIRNNYIKILKHNKNLLLDIFFGDANKNVLKFLENLTGRKL